ncbi:MAG: hypothetical protein NTV48_02420 [Candidatus Vogelbacteria bacterium]|nr:hypothetical protein [Candidatus Vogelbacteria bacterium]
MDKELLKILGDAGFTEKESSVYLALLELGAGDVSDIAKRSGLKRSIIYVILEGLIKRGYASELPNKKINTYQASDPTIILNQLKVTTKNFADFLSMFRTLRNRGQKKPKISYLDSLEGILNIYEEMCHSEKPFFMTSYSKIDKYWPGTSARWIRNYEKGFYRLKGKHLLPAEEIDTEIGKKLLKSDQQVRILDRLNRSDMDFTLFDNKLAITSFEKEPFMILIESETLTKSMLPIFEIAWEKGKEIK